MNLRSLVVTTPASDLSLLSIEELRALAGVSDGSQDADLRALGLRVAAAITSECNIAIGAGGEPTLRKETLTETIYSPRGWQISLSRRHNVSVTSISADGSLIDSSEWLVDSERGLISRVISGFPSSWWGQTFVIIYDAGFETVPGDLKQAAMDYFRALLAEAERDPFVKSMSQDIPGVMTETKDFWVGRMPGQEAAGVMPDVVAAQLKRFRNFAIA
jgi:hypothetical protein